MPRHAIDKLFSRCSIGLMALWSIVFVSGCQSHDTDTVDRLNSRAYACHYRQIDSVVVYADSALALSGGYPDGRAEALNNLAFADIARMDYAKAWDRLCGISGITDNQIELLIADVQKMRLCQRRSRNKDFYTCREQAVRRLRRIGEDTGTLTPRQQARLAYARTEFGIVASTYFYYIGLADQSAKALLDADPDNESVMDTAQVLNYWYNIGAGGIITDTVPMRAKTEEFDCLMRCYMLACEGGYVYFEAQALQGLSEHLADSAFRAYISARNRPAIDYINADHMADPLIAGNLALRSYGLFRGYGDVYQTAGASRTLAESYFAIGDYQSAIICLNAALKPQKKIAQAPDLVASIYEQLSMSWSALDDKPKSDYYRNRFLDLQENTRQDRFLEARAEQLSESSRQLSVMLAVIILMAVVLFALLAYYAFRRRDDDGDGIQELIKPLEEWQSRRERVLEKEREKLDEVGEMTDVARMHLQRNKERNLGQRAKMSLVGSISPLIDRIINEVNRLKSSGEAEPVRSARYEYIGELAAQINADNAVLTRWIQLRKGEISLLITGFRVEDLFEIIRKKHTSFDMKGIRLDVGSSADVVKADKTLTLFMINTLTDNALKFTPRGGQVTVSSRDVGDAVEISVADTGCGMSPAKAAHVFDRKPIINDTALATEPESHGFGLMNCRGIIEKYRKLSRVFSVCSIGVESREGHGSRFFFRLPKGVVRLLLPLLVMAAAPATLWARGSNYDYARRAQSFADSVYFCNVSGQYSRALSFADSSISCVNRILREHKSAGRLSLYSPDGVMAEIDAWKRHLPLPYTTILDFRNECAVAALALHDWRLYNYNNTVYTSLFHLKSADASLPAYVTAMQRSESNKTVAVILLVLLLLAIVPAWYFLYYRHLVYYRICVDRLRRINSVLLDDSSDDATRLDRIRKIWKTLPGNDSRRYASLNELASRIVGALEQSVSELSDARDRRESAVEQLHRIEYENDRLHVADSVLDNCLSTLKHETMYYPSRISQLVGSGAGIESISEVASYYRSLYTILSAQAMRQIPAAGRPDPAMLRYLLTLLERNGGGSPLRFGRRQTNGSYVGIEVLMPGLHITPAEASQLFTAQTVNLQFLLCRQIVREAGEAAGARGCGISAAVGGDGKAKVNIILTEKIWNILKL